MVVRLAAIINHLQVFTDWAEGIGLRVASLLAVMRSRALGPRLLFFYRFSDGNACARASNDESDLYAPVAGPPPPRPPPPPGKGGALATRQNKNLIKPHVKGHLVGQNPNQRRTNFPTQGASSVSLSPIVSYLEKWGAWCGWRMDPYRNQGERECARQTATVHSSQNHSPSCTLSLWFTKVNKNL